VVIGRSQVDLLEHGPEYVDGNDSIVLPLESSEQLPKHKLLVVLQLAQAHQALSERCDQVLDLFLADLKMRGLLDLPGIREEVDKLLVIEDGH